MQIKYISRNDHHRLTLPDDDDDKKLHTEIPRIGFKMSLSLTNLSEPHDCLKDGHFFSKSFLLQYPVGRLRRTHHFKFVFAALVFCAWQCLSGICYFCNMNMNVKAACSILEILKKKKKASVLLVGYTSWARSWKEGGRCFCLRIQITARCLSPP